MYNHADMLISRTGHTEKKSMNNMHDDAQNPGKAHDSRQNASSRRALQRVARLVTTRLVPHPCTVCCTKNEKKCNNSSNSSSSNNNNNNKTVIIVVAIIINISVFGMVAKRMDVCGNVSCSILAQHVVRSAKRRTP